MNFNARLDSSLQLSLQPLVEHPFPARDEAAAKQRLADRFRATIHHMQQTPLLQTVGGRTKNVEVAWAAAATTTTTPQQDVFRVVLQEDATCAGSLVAIKSLDLAQMHGVTYRGEHFVFLMSHAISSKTDSYVGHTRNPLRDVYLHNARRIPDRNTCVAAPHWHVDRVLGPFQSVAIARDCGRMLVHGTRGKIPKRKKSPFLAQGFNVPLYDASLRLPQPFADYLAQNALPLYGNVWTQLIGK